MLILLASYWVFNIFNTKHPMMVCLILVISSIQVGVFLSKSFSKWLFYLLILLFLGGMMVLFLYLASLSSKSKPNFNKSYFFIMLSVLAAYSLFYYSKNQVSFLNSFSLGGLYSISSSSMVIFVMTYLLILLLMCLKFLDVSSGALKNMF